MSEVCYNDSGEITGPSDPNKPQRTPTVNWLFRTTSINPERLTIRAPDPIDCLAQSSVDTCALAILLRRHRCPMGRPTSLPSSRPPSLGTVCGHLKK
ncbi:hypothetical protein CRUP_000549 [Coryphaenoides rupestris]|nr:hypothetical protein CRUP_000549 [Coryphaenoides rupestris]